MKKTLNKIVHTQSYNRFKVRKLLVQKNAEFTSFAYIMFAKVLEKKMKDDPDSKKSDIRNVFNLNQNEYVALNDTTEHTVNMIKSFQKDNIQHGIIRLYIIFSDYLRDILGELVIEKPEKLIQSFIEKNKNNDLNMTYKDVIDKTTIEDIKQELVNRLFRALEEERSTNKLLDKIIKLLGISIDAETKKSALRFLDLRHLYIHNNGCIDKKYFEEYKIFIGQKTFNNQKIRSNITLFKDATNSIGKLAEEFDIQIRKNDILPPQKTNTCKNNNVSIETLPLSY